MGGNVSLPPTSSAREHSSVRADTISTLPIPPLELRSLVGPTDAAAFENPSGAFIYSELRLPVSAYHSVFDFGCGCGRTALQLLQQTRVPERYLGVDPHRGMIQWCQTHISPVAPAFTFEHHDVYSPRYAPENSLQLSSLFRAADASVSLFVAHSVFTHLALRQTAYYLSELARVLTSDGYAVTTWFLFDRASLPFLQEGPYALYTDENDFAQAVLYDREWLATAFQQVGLTVQQVVRPVIAGHQWILVLRKGSESWIPPEDDAAWLCGATRRAIADDHVSAEVMALVKGRQPEGPLPISVSAAPPVLQGALLELASVKGSWSYRIGRIMTAPIRLLRSI